MRLRTNEKLYWGQVRAMSFFSALKTKRTPRHQPASFTLIYWPRDDQGRRQAEVKVGRLDFDGDLWTFRYDEEYKHRTDLRPIEGFGEIEKVYRSPVLFPFFAVRIPHESRADVRDKVDERALEERDEGELLRIFGRHVVSSPAFELIPASL